MWKLLLRGINCISSLEFICAKFDLAICSVPHNLVHTHTHTPIQARRDGMGAKHAEREMGLSGMHGAHTATHSIARTSHVHWAAAIERYAMPTIRWYVSTAPNRDQLK